MARGYNFLVPPDMRRISTIKNLDIRRAGQLGLNTEAECETGHWSRHLNGFLLNNYYSCWLVYVGNDDY